MASIVAAYAWFEAGWLRTRVVEVEVPGLPQALDGMRIGHLSDFHLGAPLSRGNGASERAAEWVASRSPELVCITGDLVSLPRGEARLRRIISLLDRPYRRSRESRRRDHARPVLSRSRARGPRRCLPLARRGGHRRGSRGAGAAGRLRPQEARRRDDDSLGARRHERPPSGSFSATTRPSFGESRPGSSASRLQATCTEVRSASRCRAAAG